MPLYPDLTVSIFWRILFVLDFVLGEISVQASVDGQQRGGDNSGAFRRRFAQIQDLDRQCSLYARAERFCMDHQKFPGWKQFFSTVLF